MTITLTPETETRLRERAARDGQEVDALADILLADALASDPDDLTAEQTAEVRAGIRRGLADCESGRAQPASAWAARLRHELGLPTYLSDDELNR